jgi:hypothetical protein
MKLNAGLIRGRWWKYVLAAVPLVVLWAVFVLCGWRGVDFGTHWDEHLLIDRVFEGLKEGRLLPRYYEYPSVSYDLIFLAFGRKVIAYTLQHFPTSLRAVYVFWKDLSASLVTINVVKFFLSARKVFVVVASLSLVWVYLLVYWWRKSFVEATVAAAVLAASWEFGYHARWVVPDAVMAQFGILTMLCLYLALHGQRWDFWIKTAAFLAGVTFATKYPGGLIVVPVLAACFVQKGIHRPLYLLRVVLFFILGIYIVAPGLFWDVTTALDGITVEFVQYTYAGLRGYTVTPGLPHLVQMLVYLLGVAFSHYLPIALLLSVLFGVGVLRVTREKSAFGILMGGFALLYVLYFSTVTVMTVRNIMIILPIMAVFIARGAAGVWSWIPWRAGKYAGAVLLAGCLAVNLFWLVSASRTIGMGQREQAQQVVEYLQQHPGQRFWVSPRVLEMLDAASEPAPKNIVADTGQADRFVFNTDDVSLKGITYWDANHIDYTDFVTGPYEVNFDFYPTWSGRNRVVVMRPSYVQPLLQIIQAPDPAQ